MREGRRTCASNVGEFVRLADHRPGLVTVVRLAAVNVGTPTLLVWADELGQALGDAPFGENLSTLDVLERDVGIGDVWQWGSATLQVTQPRWPCFKLDMFRDRDDVGPRLRSSGRTGWYLRVLEPGEVPVGGPIEVTQLDPAGVSVLDAHHAMLDRHMSPERLREVAEHPALAEQWQTPLRRRLEYLATR